MYILDSDSMLLFFRTGFLPLALALRHRFGDFLVSVAFFSLALYSLIHSFSSIRRAHLLLLLLLYFIVVVVAVLRATRFHIHNTEISKHKVNVRTLYI